MSSLVLRRRNDYERGLEYGGRDTTPAPLLKRWSSSERPPTVCSSEPCPLDGCHGTTAVGPGAAHPQEGGRLFSRRFSTVLDQERMRYCRRDL